jgi:hypothetical protein
MKLHDILIYTILFITNSAICYDIGYVYNFNYDSTVEIFKHSKNSSLPKLASFIHAEFQLEPLEYNKFHADLLLVEIKVFHKLETFITFKKNL